MSTRRTFIKRLSKTSAALSTVSLGSCRPRLSANERIEIAVIGCGYMGHLNVEQLLKDPRAKITAICDPNRESAGYFKEKTLGRTPMQALLKTKQGDKAREYIDFRELLESETPDAVLIASPDHWHGAHAVSAAGKGLAIYGQKPLANSIVEGRLICHEVAKNNIVWQTGSQQRSDSHFRRVSEMIRAGVIGKITRVEIGVPGGNLDYSRRKKDRNLANPPIPQGFDYGLWQGPAKPAPYNPARSHANWRWDFNYGGGNITDWGAHHLDIALWALDRENEGPQLLTICHAELPPKGFIYNTAKAFHYTAQLRGGLIIDVQDLRHHPTRAGGIKFFGDNGQWLSCDRGAINASNKKLFRWKPKKGENILPISKNHEANFLDAIQGKAQAIAPAEAAQRAITIAHLANVAIRCEQKELQWNPQGETLLESSATSEATALLDRKWQAPWDNIRS